MTFSLPRLSRIFPLEYLLILLTLNECGTVRVNRELYQVEQAQSINAKRKYVKIHMKTGNVYVLHSWIVDESKRQITGLGNHLDVNRRIIQSNGSDEKNKQATSSRRLSPFVIPYDEIVLVETNDTGTNPGVAAMGFTAVATGVFAILCAINPKACFGSCPTFFVDQGDSLKLVGEGFSSSINQALEANDVDMIQANVETGKNDFYLTVKNEALETHMIKKLRIILANKDSGTSVLRDVRGDFYQVSDFESPESATLDHSSILESVSKRDDQEWHSLSDSLDLTKKEEINLVFDNPKKMAGLVITKRQSLVTTFLFYHSLSLLGNSAGYYYSQMTTGAGWIKKRSLKLYELLGGIEVWVANEKGHWTKVSEINEQGPIAEDTHLVLLPKSIGEKISVKVRMSKGLWRINHLGLGTILEKTETISLKPVRVWKDGVEDQRALGNLLSENNYLATYPTETYRIQYSIPEVRRYEYFIESQGYYVEWMREEWLSSADAKGVKTIFRNPHGFLKSMAPVYKMNEPEMERVFWNSRYSKN